MAHRLIDDSLVIASHNPGKVSEIRDLLHPFGLIIQSAVELDLPEPEETGTSFSENAILKASTYGKFCGKLTFADDSGIEVVALD